MDSGFFAQCVLSYMCTAKTVYATKCLFHKLPIFKRSIFIKILNVVTVVDNIVNFC